MLHSVPSKRGWGSRCARISVSYANVGLQEQLSAVYGNFSRVNIGREIDETVFWGRVNFVGQGFSKGAS